LKLSVIIATHARPAALARLIESLAPQLIPDERELFIADNGTPAPSPIPAAIARLTHLHDPQPGKCRLQNRAISKARGAIVACLDDDLVVSPRYLDEVERFFEQHPEFAAMKGRIVAAEDPVKKVGVTAVYLDLPVTDHGDNVIEVRGVLGANMAFRRDALIRVGPFDERLGPGAAGHEEETEISARLRKAGFRIGYAPAAVVYHDVDPARADRERFLRVARERGRCRMLHERHSRAEVILKNLTAMLRLGVARGLGAGLERVAREERRLAIARGMMDGSRKRNHFTAA
jgi:GT2 family glycosyltransferase